MSARLPAQLLALLAAAGAVAAGVLGAAAEPAPGRVSDLRHWSYADYTRVVVELTRPVETQVRHLPAESGRRERLYLDLPGIRLEPAAEARIRVADGLLDGIRLGQYDASRARLVLDLERYQHHRLLRLRAPDRIVVDVYGGPRPSASRQPARLPLDLRPVHTVVLDAGHGGRDPGAVGLTGLREKDVVRRLAESLRPRLEAAGFRVVLTREGDETRTLEERTAIAEGAGGDVFVSLHANAARRRGARGIETYYLDETHERHTLRIAAIENGISTRDLDELQRTVASLRVSELSEHSAALASHLHGELIRGLRGHYESVEDLGVKRGPFYVLFLSTMPAVLIETGFLTNRDESRRLGSHGYIELVADRIAAGLGRYRERRALLLAEGRR